MPALPPRLLLPHASPSQFTKTPYFQAPDGGAVVSVLTPVFLMSHPVQLQTCWFQLQIPQHWSPCARWPQPPSVLPGPSPQTPDWCLHVHPHPVRVSCQRRTRPLQPKCRHSLLALTSQWLPLIQIGAPWGHGGLPATRVSSARQALLPESL